MASKKQQVRAAFRDACFKRDGYKCICCGLVAPDKSDAESVLDAHHITNRNEFPNGGYVKENGATLCKNDKPNERSCHFKAEEWLANGKGEEGYDPATLYAKIGSSREKAFAADAKLA